MSREQKLLDALEDARDDLARWQRTVWYWSLAAAGSVVTLLCGVFIGSWGTWHHVDTGGFAIGPIVLGIFGLIGTAIGICAWLDHTSPNPARALRNAERAYRDYLNGDT